jgi:hypothetical protein
VFLVLITAWCGAGGGAVGWGTSRKVASLIPDGDTGIIQWFNLSCRTIAQGSTQPLTEMDIMADNLTTFTCWLSGNLGASTFWNLQGLERDYSTLLLLAVVPCHPHSLSPKYGLTTEIELHKNHNVYSSNMGLRSKVRKCITGDISEQQIVWKSGKWVSLRGSHIIRVFLISYLWNHEG